MKNSNQTGALLLLALVLGAAVYAFMFFGSSMEQTNMSASFGQLLKSKSVNLLSDNKEKTVDAEFLKKEVRSDLSGVTLPGYKMKSTSGGNYAQTSNVDFPTNGIEQADAQNMNRTTTASRTINYARNESQSFAFGNSTVQYISNPQNPTKSDINALLLLDTHAAEAAMSSTQQGSKRATSSLTAKTASVSSSLTSTNAKKINSGGNPGEPNPGGSLPVGDGIFILILLAASYSLMYNRFFYSWKH